MIALLRCGPRGLISSRGVNQLTFFYLVACDISTLYVILAALRSTDKIHSLWQTALSACIWSERDGARHLAAGMGRHMLTSSPPRARARGATGHGEQLRLQLERAPARHRLVVEAHPRDVRAGAARVQRRRGGGVLVRVRVRVSVSVRGRGRGRYRGRGRAGVRGRVRRPC